MNWGTMNTCHGIAIVAINLAVALPLSGAARRPAQHQDVGRVGIASGRDDLDPRAAREGLVPLEVAGLRRLETFPAIADSNWTSVIAFTLMAGFLLFVGLGKIISESKSEP